MSDAVIAMGLLLVVVITGYAAWRVPRLRDLLAKGIGWTFVAGLLVWMTVRQLWRSNERETPRGRTSVGDAARDAIDDQADEHVQRIHRDAEKGGLADQVNAGRR